MKDTILEMRRRLEPLYGVSESRAMIREIFLSLKGWDATELTIRQAEDYRLSDYMRSKVEEILGRLEHYEPLQYILGSAHFYGLDLHVEPGVLIPRPETEDLVQQIVTDNKADDLRVADLGTGSGAIAVALSRNLSFPQITAVDNSDTALKVAAENANALHCRNIRVEKADILNWKPEAESFDIIVSNPPYVDESEKSSMEKNVLDYEPAEALFVPDDDPLRYYNAIAPAAMKSLAPGGRIYFEINPRHADAVVQMLTANGFSDVQKWRDERGLYRFVKARKPDADD